MEHYFAYILVKSQGKRPCGRFHKIKKHKNLVVKDMNVYKDDFIFNKRTKTNKFRDS